MTDKRGEGISEYQIASTKQNLYKDINQNIIHIASTEKILNKDMAISTRTTVQIVRTDQFLNIKIGQYQPEQQLVRTDHILNINWI